MHAPLWNFVSERSSPPSRFSKKISKSLMADLPEARSLEDGTNREFTNKNTRNMKGRLYQCLAAIAGNITTFMAGIVIGWTSPTLPELERKFNLDSEQISWISSLMPLGGIFGPFLGGFLAKKFGTKKALLLSSIPAINSWLIIPGTESVGAIMFARFLAGVSLGWIFTVLPMYCGEISHKSIRGAIGSLMQVFICLGITFVYGVGGLTNYIIVSAMSICFILFFILVFYWMPESPYYLLADGNKENAVKSLQWLRQASSDEISEELSDIQVNVEKSKNVGGSLLDLFATKGTIRALIVSLGLVAFQQLSGINVVLFYASSIFAKSTMSMDSALCAFILALVMLVASCVTPLAVDKFGRKILLFISGWGMGMAQIILGISVLTGFQEWLPTVAILVYIIVYCLGFGPLPWAIMGEMFPGNIKSLASTITACFCWILTFLLTRFFTDMWKALGAYTFIFFGVFCVISIPFVHFVVPETKNKTLNEIQNILNKRMLM